LNLKIFYLAPFNCEEEDILSYGFQFGTLAAMLLPTTPLDEIKSRYRISTFHFLLLAPGTREFGALLPSYIQRTGLQVAVLCIQNSQKRGGTE